MGPVDPVADYLAALGNPLGSSAAPTPAGAVSAPAGPSPWETVLRAALPAVAGFFAARNGQLGSFTQGYGQMQAQQARQEQLDRQFQLEREQADLGRRREAARIAIEQQELAAKQEEARIKREDEKRKIEAAQKKAETEVVQKSLDEAAKNPLLNTLIATFGADAFTLKTPLGPMSVAEAQKRGAIVPGQLGSPDLPKPERKPLITTPGPDGTPVRAEDKPGLRVYERPRRPREPKEPAKPRTYRYTWKDDDPASDTYGQSFRVVEDENGNVISKTRMTAGAAPASSAGTPRSFKQGRFTVEVEN